MLWLLRYVKEETSKINVGAEIKLYSSNYITEYTVMFTVHCTLYSIKTTAKNIYIYDLISGNHEYVMHIIYI